MAINPYEQEAPEETPGIQEQQDRSKVPAYPYLMNGQQGWPTLDQQPQVEPNNYYNTGINGGQQPMTPVAQQQPPSTWNTDQYAAPQYTAQNFNQNAMAGWDQNKWGSGDHQTPKYAVGRILSQFAPSKEGLAQATQQIAQAYPGATFNGKDKVNIPGVGEIDMLQNSGSGQNMAWMWGTGDDGIDHGGDAAKRAGLSGGGSGGGGSLGGGTGSFGSGSGSWSSSGTQWGDKANSLYDVLMGRANQSLNVGEKDPIIAGQVNAFRAEQQRGVRNNLAQAAEAGGPQNNMNMERRMMNEKASQATGGLQASLMQNELNARRQEIQQALSLGANMLTEQQRLGLSRELGLINANLDQQRVTNQNNQFTDRLGLDVTDRANYWDALRSGLLNG